MKLPFPHWTLNTNAKVLTVTINEYSEQTEHLLYEGKVNFVQKSKQIMNAQRELIVLSGWVVVPGDLGLGIDLVKKPLYVDINGDRQRIMHVNCPHNPDGTIFASELFF